MNQSLKEKIKQFISEINKGEFEKVDKYVLLGLLHIYLACDYSDNLSALASYMLRFNPSETQTLEDSDILSKQEFGN